MLRTCSRIIALTAMVAGPTAQAAEPETLTLACKGTLGQDWHSCDRRTHRGFDHVQPEHPKNKTVGSVRPAMQADAKETWQLGR
jgi:hypothetical protein